MDNLQLSHRGRPSMEEMDGIKNRFIGIIKDVQVVHPESIRRLYSEKYSKMLTWRTVRKYLDQLLSEQKIREHVILEGKRRTISVFRVNL